MPINGDAERIRYHHNEGFGAFSPPVEGGAGYLTFLNLERPDATQTISLIMKSCASLSNPYQEICLLRAKLTGDPHLVGAVAMASLAHDSEDTCELWSAIDNGSWVTSQRCCNGILVRPDVC